MKKIFNLFFICFFTLSITNNICADEKFSCLEKEILCTNENNVSWCCSEENVCDSQEEQCCLNGTCCPKGSIAYCTETYKEKCLAVGCCPSDTHFIHINENIKDYGYVYWKCTAKALCSSEETSCGSSCCSEKQQCIDHKCCPATQICSNKCCPKGQTCINDNECSCGIGKTTCKNWCCDQSNTCGPLEGQCCQDEMCCPDEQRAFCFRYEDGACRSAGCCPKDGVIKVVYQDSNSFMQHCIESDNFAGVGLGREVKQPVCENDNCCSALEESCGSSCCQIGQTCRNGICCNKGEECGETCCSSDQKCFNGECICPKEMVSCGSWCCQQGNRCGSARGQCCLDETCCPPNEVAFCFKSKNGVCERWGCCPSQYEIRTVFDSTLIGLKIAHCYYWK